MHTAIDNEDCTQLLVMMQLHSYQLHSFHLQLTHSKKYRSEHEESLRFEIFRDNKHKIAKHNQRFLNGEVSYSVDVNKYADLLPREFAEKMNGFNRSTENRYKGVIFRSARVRVQRRLSRVSI